MTRDKLRKTKPLQIIPCRRDVATEDGIRGKKTKLYLEADRLDYVIDYNYDAKIVREDIEDAIMIDANSKDINLVVKEEGTVMKDCITTISKSVDNILKEDSQELSFNIDINFNGITLGITTETEEEQEVIYSKLYNWKHNQETHD